MFFSKEMSNSEVLNTKRKEETMKKISSMVLIIFALLIANSSNAAEGGDVGSSTCREVQLMAQDLVQKAKDNGRGGRNLFKVAVVVPRGYYRAGEITKSCRKCIIKQFRKGIDPQEECGVIQPPQCGDGLLDPGEQCDDGNEDLGDGCDTECAFEPECGNGVVEVGELCDDGNRENGDGCSSSCAEEEEEVVKEESVEVDPVCGNGEVEPGEECDDANTNAFDGCDGCLNAGLFELDEALLHDALSHCEDPILLYFISGDPIINAQECLEAFEAF